MSQQWWVYMVETETGKLYTGISTDVERRFQEHCNRNNNKGAKFFRSDRAKALVFQQPCENRSEATKKEAAIKKLSRREKCLLAGMTYQPVNRK